MGLYSRAQIVDGTGWPVGAHFWHVDRDKVERLAAALHDRNISRQDEQPGDGINASLAAAAGDLLGALS